MLISQGLDLTGNAGFDFPFFTPFVSNFFTYSVNEIECDWEMRAGV